MAKNVYWRREILTFYIRISFDMDKVLSFYKAIASEKRRRRKRNKNNTMFGVGGGFLLKNVDGMGVGLRALSSP